MDDHPPAAVLYTVNLAPLAGFYQEVASLPLRKADPDYIVLGNAAFRLIVLQIPAQYASHIVIAAPPAIRESGPIKLSFPVASIAGAREAAARLGGCVYGPEREWQYESSRICDGWDPDGNVFQLFQPAVSNPRATI